MQKTRDGQLHIRVTSEQLALFKLAAEREGVTLSAWAVALMSAAAVPRAGARPRPQRRADMRR